MLSLIFSIVIIYLIYYVWIVINFDKTGNPRKSKGKRGRPKNENKKRKMPAEIEFFVIKYKIDLNKVKLDTTKVTSNIKVVFDSSKLIEEVNIDKIQQIMRHLIYKQNKKNYNNKYKMQIMN